MVKGLEKELLFHCFGLATGLYYTIFNEFSFKRAGSTWPKAVGLLLHSHYLIFVLGLFVLSPNELRLCCYVILKNKKKLNLLNYADGCFVPVYLPMMELSDFLGSWLLTLPLLS